MRIWLWLWALALFLCARPLPGQRPQNFELGGGFSRLTSIAAVGPCGCDRERESGLAANFDARLAHWLSLDTELAFYPLRGTDIPFQAGGRVTEALFGVRLDWPLPFANAGLRKHLRLFVLARPGIVSYGTVVTRIISATFPPKFNFGRKTDSAVNLGGGVLVRLSEHTELRLELGDTIIFGQRPSAIAPLSHTDNKQFGVSYVFAF